MGWNYIKNCGSWVNYSVMDSYYDKSCDICAQTVSLLAYELFRARSTRIAYEFRIFFNPLFRVEIFEYAMPIQNHMDAKSGYFFYPVTPHYRAQFFTVNIQDGAERNFFASLLL